MSKVKRGMSAIVMSMLLMIGSSIPSGTVVMANPMNTPEAFETTLKILELQPGSGYVLTDKEGDLEEYFGVDSVEIEQMPITLFNADRSELNGKYDVIYLGMGLDDGKYVEPSLNKVYNHEAYLKNNPEMYAKTYTHHSKSKHDSVYRYIERYGELAYSYVRGKIQEGSNNLIVTEINDNKPTMAKTIFYEGVDNGQYESFEPIDITQLKQKELIEQVSKGQMMILDKRLVEEKVVGSKRPQDMDIVEAVQGTNMQTLAKSINGKTNVVLIEDAKNNIGAFETAGNNYRNTQTKKRPYLEVIEDVQDTINDKEGRNLGFKVIAHNYNVGVDEPKLKINVYMDVNGNGNFEDKEFFERASVDGEGKGLTNKQCEGGIGIQLPVPLDYGGYFHYKIEVVDTSTGLCNYITDSKAYIAPEPQVIRILHLIPNQEIYVEDGKAKRNDDRNTFSLISDAFKKMYTAGELDSKDAVGLENYVFDIETIRVEELEAIYAKDAKFKGIDENKPVYEILETAEKLNAGKSMGEILDTLLPDNGKYSRLNGEYDMIIMGFADNYEHISSNALILDIMSFIETGQSVMFTHDAMGLAKDSSWVIGKDEIDGKKVDYTFEYTTEKKNKVSKKVYDKVSGQELGRELTLAMREIVGQGTYNPTATEDRLGYVNYLVHGMRVGLGSETRSVKKISEAQITEYPYVIGDDKGSSISIGQTHHQWYNVDLEDEAVNVWYTLTGGEYNWYDPMQSYYTYSKGNITYSGTGHREEYSEQEEKMFVNTIVKAANTANHAPMVHVLDLAEGQMVDYEKELIFTMRLDDIDLLDQYADYEIYLYTEEKPEDAGEHWLPDTALLVGEASKVKLGKDIKVNLTAEQIQQALEKDKEGKVINGQNLKVAIKAKDEAGAEALKTIDVKAMKPFVTITYDHGGKEGYLIGDMSSTKVKVSVDQIDRVKDLEVVFTYKKDNAETGKFIAKVEKNAEGNLVLKDKNGKVLKDKHGQPIVSKNSELVFDIDQEVEGITGNVLQADVTYQFEEDTYTSTTKENIPSGEGRLTVKVTGEHGEALGNVKVNVTAPDGTVTVHTTQGSGILTLNKQTTGIYSIAIPEQEGYTIKDEAKPKQVTLAFDKSNSDAYQKTVTYTLNSAPIIHADQSGEKVTMLTTEIFARLDGTGSVIKEAKYLYSSTKPNTSEGAGYLNTVKKDGTTLALKETLSEHLKWDDTAYPKPKDDKYIKWVEFPVKKNGWYTIYAKDDKNQEVIYTIEVDKILDLPDIT